MSYRCSSKLVEDKSEKSEDVLDSTTVDDDYEFGLESSRLSVSTSFSETDCCYQRRTDPCLMNRSDSEDDYSSANSDIQAEDGTLEREIIQFGSSGRLLSKNWKSLLLEALSVLMLISIFLFLGVLSMCFLFVFPFFTGNWYFTMAYLAFWLWDFNAGRQGGRSGWFEKFMRNQSFWKHFVNYFPIKIVKTADILPNKNYILCSHPHGIICFGVFGAFLGEGAGFSKLFPGIRPKLLTLDGSLILPGTRELIMGMSICSASKSSLEYLLKSPAGSAPLLVVGGLPEIANPDKDKITLVIKKRKGFIKLALQHGADLVPVFTFGEIDLFSHLRTINSYLQGLLKQWVGFSPIFFKGRGILQGQIGVLPQRRPLHVVVGRPISVEKTDKPTIEDIERLQEKYIQSTVQLYQEHKHKYGHSDRQLIIT